MIQHSQYWVYIQRNLNQEVKEPFDFRIIYCSITHSSQGRKSTKVITNIQVDKDDVAYVCNRVLFIL